MHIKIILGCLSAPILGALLHFINEWLSETEKEKIRDYLRQFENRLRATGPGSVIKAPLVFISDCCDEILGIQLISSKAFKRSVVASLILSILSLFTTGVLTKNFFCLNPSPWKAYSVSAEIAEKTIEAVESDKKISGDVKVSHYIEKTKSIVTKLHNRNYQIAYSLGFYALAFFLCSLLTFVTSAVSRQILREIISSGGPITLICVLAFNFIVIACLTTLVVVILGLYLLPLCWPVAALIIVLSFKWIYVGIIATFISSLLAWLLTPVFIKIVAILGFLPGILLCLVVLLTVVLYPWPLTVYKALIEFCRRSIEHKNGPLAVATAFFVFIALVVALFINYYWP